MTTLVLADLHLGLRSGGDLLRRADVRARLLAQLGDVERVVLLGDVIDLRQRPLAQALAAARPFFEELGAAVPDAEVVLVPGNHDHRLLAAWHERRRARPGMSLGLEQRIAPRADDPTGTLAAWLAPARLTLAYPGVWLRPDVYATHGHYLDRHTALPTLERLAIGALGWLVDPVPERAVAEDYEAALAPLYALAHELAQTRSRGPAPSALRRALGPGRGDRPPRVAALGPALPVLIAALNRLGLGPLRAEVAVDDLLPTGLRAMGLVCERLGIDAAFVVFGHLHRAGPHADDDPTAWVAPNGARLVAAGSWVVNRQLSTAGPAGRRYSAGMCIRVDAVGAPTLTQMLEGAGTPGQPGSGRPFEPVAPRRVTREAAGAQR